MNITAKIIITDTNIITDLNNANILEEFIELDNVYISDMIKRDEINSKTGNIELISKFKEISATAKELTEVYHLSRTEKKLSIYDLLNFVLARDNNCILATGDNKLKVFSENNGVEVFRTLKIIRLMIENNIISCQKAIQACVFLKKCTTTRITEMYINNFIEEIKKKL